MVTLASSLRRRRNGGQATVYSFLLETTISHFASRNATVKRSDARTNQPVERSTTRCNSKSLQLVDVFIACAPCAHFFMELT